LADAGFRFFFVDAHLASAGRPLGLSGDPAALDPEMHHPAGRATAEAAQRTPYQPYRVAQHRGAVDVSAYVRDPRASMQVWSRFEGYPGDGVYLEFHKMRWPGGLKLWRVSGSGVDLGAKEPYDPDQALDRARGHADHFAGLLGGIASAEAQRRDGVIVAPFDTELFGHWWFEGPDFLGDVYRALRGRPDVRPTTGSGHLLRHPSRAAIRMPSGSWGANGDFSMWLSEQTAWTWERLWPLEERFWDAAPAALGSEQSRFVLAQAARELLLAQSSDWQFILSTGAAADYGERRFREHCSETEELVDALVDGSPEALERGSRRAAELGERDAIFPDVLPAISAALAGSRSLPLG
jgi:1,4-alpha-glucan branching enzyme